jgi:hypothetical protein
MAHLLREGVHHIARRRHGLAQNRDVDDEGKLISVLAV